MNPNTDGWVPIFVPAELAADVLRAVAEHARSGRGTAGAGPLMMGPSQWADATPEDMEVFFRGALGLEWRLVVELAGHDRPVPVGELAEALGVEVGAVAGAIGPINKRAKREGWAAPIQPTRFYPDGEGPAKRGLLLAEALRAWTLARNAELTAGAGRAP